MIIAKIYLGSAAVAIGTVISNTNYYEKGASAVISSYFHLKHKMNDNHFEPIITLLILDYIV